MKFKNEELQPERIMNLSKKLVANEELTEKECFDILFAVASDLVRKTSIMELESFFQKHDIAILKEEIL